VQRITDQHKRQVSTLVSIALVAWTPQLCLVSQKILSIGRTVPSPGGQISETTSTPLPWPSGQGSSPPRYFITAQPRSEIALRHPLGRALAQPFSSAH